MTATLTLKSNHAKKYALCITVGHVQVLTWKVDCAAEAKGMPAPLT